MLFKRYAPTALDGVVGQDKAVAVLRRLEGRYGGRAYWITGSSGTGKTTLANIIASDLSDEWGTIEVDASGVSGAKVTELERSLAVPGLFKRGRVAVVNEAHGLRRDGIRQLLITLERIPEHVAWVFTTTTDGNSYLFDECDDAAPLVSRCLKLDLARQGLCKPFTEHVVRIAAQESIEVSPKRVESLMKECRNNLRMVLSALETL